MKKIYLVLLLVLLSLSVFAIDIKTVDPAFWWSGMKNPELQVLIHGEGVAKSDVSITSKSVRLKETVKLESPNYLIYISTYPELNPKSSIVYCSRARTRRWFLMRLKAGSPAHPTG